MRLAKLNCPHPPANPHAAPNGVYVHWKTFPKPFSPCKTSTAAPRDEDDDDDDHERPPPQLLGPSAGADGQQVVRESRFRSSKKGGQHSFLETGAGPKAPESARSRPGNVTLLLRPKVFHVLDFPCSSSFYPPGSKKSTDIRYLAARLTHWGTGPTPFMRCWVQMVCGDMALFDSVAAFTHGRHHVVAQGAGVEGTASQGINRGGRQSSDMDSERDDPGDILPNGRSGKIWLRGEVASACLKDLYVMQAVGLVEGTEMASELRHGIIQDGHQSSNNEPAAVTSITTRSELRYLRPGLQLEEPLRAMIDTLPVGFRDLVALGNLSIEFILLLEEQLHIKYKHGGCRWSNPCSAPYPW
ncbi:hypothetical protein V1506DRAFT_520363 [Lipomyces tetrasporus]